MSRRGSELAYRPTLSASEALTVLQYLDALRESLWWEYREVICDDVQSLMEEPTWLGPEHQQELDFEDDIPF